MKHFSAGLGALAFVLVFLVALVSGQSGAVPTQDPSNVDIHPELKSEFEQPMPLIGMFMGQGTERAEIIVKLEDYKKGTTEISEMKSQASKSRAPLVKMAEKNPNIEVKDKFWITNAVLLEAKTDIRLENIASVQGVQSLNINPEIKALQSVNSSEGSEVGPQASNTYGLNQINVSETWSQFDTKGEGVKVSVIDTGVDINHDDIDLFTTDGSDPTYPGGWAEYNGGKVDGSEPKICSHGGGDHGTHVSGTVSGGNASGTNIGVAPNVDLMNVGALMAENAEGDCVGSLSDITGAMEWSVNNDADILSMSLGAPGKFDTFISSVRNAESAGVIVIGAAGNSGEGTSISPGNVYEATAVGASDSNEDIASFSSGEEINTSEAWISPPSEWPEEYIVPDISGPGAGVYSSEPGNTYGYKQGTSMATPHVSGAAALMQSATYKRLSPENISEAFVQTAWKPDSWSESSASSSIDGQDTRYGHGIIDAYAATEYAVENFDKGVIVENVTVNTSSAEVEETFGVSGDVENLRNEQNNVPLELKFNSTSAENLTVNLNANQSKSFQFTQSISEVGLYDVYVNETLAGTVDVYMPDPEFSITSGINASEIVEGESVNVSGTVNNAGGDGDADLRLLRNGSEIDQKNVFVPFESSKEYSFVRQFNQPGYYNVSVNGTGAGNLNVLNDAELNLSNFKLNNSEQFFENDTVKASATAENVGDVSGIFNISLTVDGSNDQSVIRNISGGSSQNISFDKKFNDRGNYSLAIGNLSKNLEVLQRGSVNLLNGSLSENRIIEGSSVNYTLKYENPGDVQASRIIDFEVNSSTEESRNISVNKQSTGQSNFTRIFNTPGNYTLSADSSFERDLEVLDDAKLNVTGLSLSNSRIVEGQNISANVSVENIGDVGGIFNVTMNITGNKDFFNSENVMLQNGSSTNVGFSQSIQDPGNYSAEAVNYTRDFQVLKKANISIVNSIVNSTEIFIGQALGFNATVNNSGDVNGSDYLNYSIDGLEKISSTREVSPGLKNLSETLVPKESGNFSAKVNGSNIASVEVKRPNVSIGNTSFNISERGLLEIETLLNNTDPGTVNESLQVSINDSNFSRTYFLDKNEERNVTSSIDWNQTGFYVLKLNNSEIGNFSLDPFAEFTDLSPNGSTYNEGDSINFSGKVYSVGEPNLTISTGESVFESNLSSGLNSFSFQESPAPGSFEWSAEASFSNSTFQSEKLSYQVEEESSDSDDGGGGGGGSGGSGGSSGGFSGGYVPEPELKVNESSDSISIKAPEGDHSIVFNNTDLPIKTLSFSSDQEGTINFSSESLEHNGSMESVFKAQTDLQNGFNISVEASKNWAEENKFNISQVSFYRFEDGWTDLDPERDEKDDSIVLSSRLDSFSVFGVGVDQACYLMEEVQADVDGACRSYDTICQAPQNAEVVDSCGSSDSVREERIRDKIQQAKGENVDDERIKQAEAALNEGNLEEAERLVEQSSRTGFRIPEVAVPGYGSILMVSGGLVLLLISALAAIYLVRPVYREKMLIRKINQLTARIKNKAENGEDIEKLAKMVVRADEALINENYDEAEKIIEDAERIR